MSGFLKRLATAMTEGASVSAIRPRQASRFEPVTAADATIAAGSVEAETEVRAPSPARRAAPVSVHADGPRVEVTSTAERATTVSTPSTSIASETAAGPTQPLPGQTPQKVSPPTRGPTEDMARSSIADREFARATTGMPGPAQPTHHLASTPLPPVEGAAPITGPAIPRPFAEKAQQSRAAARPVDAARGESQVVAPRERVYVSLHAPASASTPAPAPATAGPLSPRAIPTVATRESADPTVVEINIGTVEVRNPAPAPAPRAARPALGRAGPRLGLQAYLERRSRK